MLIKSQGSRKVYPHPDQKQQATAEEKAAAPALDPAGRRCGHRRLMANAQRQSHRPLCPGPPRPRPPAHPRRPPGPPSPPARPAAPGTVLLLSCLDRGEGTRRGDAFGRNAVPPATPLCSQHHDSQQTLGHPTPPICREGTCHRRSHGHTATQPTGPRGLCGPPAGWPGVPGISSTDRQRKRRVTCPAAD